jgi:hypothetical protein
MGSRVLTNVSRVSWEGSREREYRATRYEQCSAEKSRACQLVRVHKRGDSGERGSGTHDLRDPPLALWLHRGEEAHGAEHQIETDHVEPELSSELPGKVDGEQHQWDRACRSDDQQGEVGLEMWVKQLPTLGA